MATNDEYATGALVLANSLVRARTTRKKVVMVTPGDIKKELLDALHKVGTYADADGVMRLSRKG